MHMAVVEMRRRRISLIEILRGVQRMVRIAGRVGVARVWQSLVAQVLVGGGLYGRGSVGCGGRVGSRVSVGVASVAWILVEISGVVVLQGPVVVVIPGQTVIQCPMSSGSVLQLW